MVISDKLRCIFVHIQKTGGISIESVLRQGDPAIGSHLHEGRRHLSAREIAPLVQPSQWSDYFKFAFVRNPWDRLVSWHCMCVQSKNPNRFADYVQRCAPTFEAFVTRAVTGPGEKTTRNQLDYLTDAHGAMIVDFVGRYETLNEDFAQVRQRLQLSAELPHANQSSHRDYREYYTAETREIVAQRFARDIRQFGYEF